jgi:hypothetical protein
VGRIILLARPHDDVFTDFHDVLYRDTTIKSLQYCVITFPAVLFKFSVDARFKVRTRHHGIEERLRLVTGFLAQSGSRLQSQVHLGGIIHHYSGTYSPRKCWGRLGASHEKSVPSTHFTFQSRNTFLHMANMLFRDCSLSVVGMC